MIGKEIKRMKRMVLSKLRINRIFRSKVRQKPKLKQKLKKEQQS